MIITPRPRQLIMPKGRKLFHSAKTTGIIIAELWRNGMMLQHSESHNGIVDEGENYLLNVAFGGAAAQAQASPWYIGIVDNAAFSAFADADIMSAHAGWAEWQDYTAAARIEWVDESSTAKSKSNSVTTADFTVGVAGEGDALKGIFVTSISTKGGTTGFLWSTGAFSAVLNVQQDDVIKVTYTITVTD